VLKRARESERRLLGIITGIIKETWFAEMLKIVEDEASRIQRIADVPNNSELLNYIKKVYYS
jgi:hypothetical protein